MCESLFRQLHSDGVGCESKVITKKEENLLWSKKILGLHSPVTAVFLRWKSVMLKGPRRAPRSKIISILMTERP